jgi:hypothetical protein
MTEIGVALAATVKWFQDAEQAALGAKV